MTTWRDVHGSALRQADEGRAVTVAGWVARRRDHGGLIFVDLRDEGGVLQVVINPANAAEASEVAHELRNEFVVRAHGTVVRRTPETINPAMTTGEIEIQADSLEIISRSTPLPFQLDDEGVEDNVRMR
jgi:aspartyl-tRNA synthetase